MHTYNANCPLHVHSQTLYDLAQVCAGVAAMCGKQVNSELLGAFRALCLPTTIFKFCQSGYSQLITRNNVSQFHTIIIVADGSVVCGDVCV